MRAMLLALIGLSTTALAEEPAEVVWTVREIESLRYFDADFVGPTFEKGDEVEVVIRHEGLIRVFADGRFGWLPGDAVTTERPAILASDFASMVEESAAQPEGGPGAEKP